MLSKILSLGDRLELIRVMSEEKRKQVKLDNTIEAKPFISQIYDIINEEQLKIAMPITEGRVIPLPVSARYDVYFFTMTGLYRSRVVILDRYKEDALYVLVVEIMSELKKYQRRQYFRLECTFDIEYRVLQDLEVENFIKEPDLINEDVESGVYTPAIVLDISGGGVRFASEEKLEPGGILLINLNIATNGGKNIYGVLARTFSSTKIINKDKMFEQRVEYMEIAGHTREAIIKFIFEQERKMRKKI